MPRQPVTVSIDPHWLGQRESLERSVALLPRDPDRWLSPRRVLRRMLALSGLAGIGRRQARRLSIERIDHHTGSVDPGATSSASVVPVRLLQISDPHFPEVRDREREAMLRAAIAAIDHDVLVLTGDVRDRSFGPFEGAMSALQHVIEASEAPAFAVLGNHDPAALIQPLASLGVHTLVNACACVALLDGRVTLAVAGIDDPARFRLHDIEAALAGIPLGTPTVLLAHSPVIADDVPGDRVRLCLCGHTHGGQIVAPGGWVPRLASAVREVAPDTVSGRWRRERLAGYTCRGLGTSVVDARFFCPPELALHRLFTAAGAVEQRRHVPHTVSAVTRPRTR